MLVDDRASDSRGYAPSRSPDSLRIFGHHPVARDLGDDRGGGDRAALGVAVDDRLRRPLPARAGIAVDQHPGRLDPERLDRASHRQHARPVDVDAVDLLDRGDADATSGDLRELRVKRLALLERQILEIVDPAREFVAVEDAGGGDDRARRAARILPRRRPRAAAEIELELEGAAAGHAPKPMEQAQQVASQQIAKFVD